MIHSFNVIHSTEVIKKKVELPLQQMWSENEYSYAAPQNSVRLNYF